MMTSNLRYLLCELNDENYTEPTFTVFDSHESAFKQAVERCTGVLIITKAILNLNVRII